MTEVGMYSRAAQFIMFVHDVLSQQDLLLGSDGARNYKSLRAIAGDAEASLATQGDVDLSGSHAGARSRHLHRTTRPWLVPPWAKRAAHVSRPPRRWGAAPLVRSTNLVVGRG